MANSGCGSGAHRRFHVKPRTSIESLAIKKLESAQCTQDSKELTWFQQDQVGMTIMTFGCVQSWHGPAATNNTNAQLSAMTMAKCRSQRRSQTVSWETKDTSAESPASQKLHNARKIPRTELVSAKSMTAIVKSGRFLAFSETRSGWSFQQIFECHTCITRAGKHKCELFELAVFCGATRHSSKRKRFDTPQSRHFTFVCLAGFAHILP
jgi:hypothetical protein